MRTICGLLPYQVHALPSKLTELVHATTPSIRTMRTPCVVLPLGLRSCNLTSWSHCCLQLSHFNHTTRRNVSCIAKSLAESSTRCNPIPNLHHECCTDPNSFMHAHSAALATGKNHSQPHPGVVNSRTAQVPCHSLVCMVPSAGVFSQPVHNAHTLPITTLFIPRTRLKTTHLQKRT